MTTITFDTLKFTQHLERAGISHEQAVAFAEAQKESLSVLMEGQSVGKTDIQTLRSDIQAIRGDIGELRHELREQESRLIIKMGALMAFSIGIVAALVKML
jgi:hypothetical protein